MTYTSYTGSGSNTGGSNGSGGSTSTDSWFEAIAKAWGAVLDKQAQKVSDLSSQIGNGTDQPSIETQLSASAQRMNFLANASGNTINSIGQALQTMARKD